MGANAPTRASADETRPARFWDGFRWVDTPPAGLRSETTGALDHAPRRDRRLHVGNLPIDSGLSEKQIGEFLTSGMANRGYMSHEAPSPILSVSAPPNGNYAFVEFHSVEAASQALSLNGIMLLNHSLRISRPDTHGPPLGGVAVASHAAAGGATSSGSHLGARAVAAPPPGLAAKSRAAFISATASPLTSRVLSFSNMLTPVELADAEEREALKEDLADECGIFGKILAMKVPTTDNATCNIFVAFATEEAAGRACVTLSGRKFDGRVVTVSHCPEARFRLFVDGG